MRKCLVVSFHNYRSFRIAGFHKICEALAENGWHVYLYSAQRPWIGLLKSDERLGRKALLSLFRGIEYKHGKGKIINFTIPSIQIPFVLRNIIGLKNWEKIASIHIPFFKNKMLSIVNDPDLLIFESCSGLLDLSHIKELYPGVPIIYRPSDPIAANENMPIRKKREEEILKLANLILLVNKEAKLLYESSYDISQNIMNRMRILRNGFDLKVFGKKYPVPKEYVRSKRKKILYFGAHPPDWCLIKEVCLVHSSSEVFIICPSRPNRSEWKIIRSCGNLTFIPGLFPERIPAFVQHCDIVIIPYKSEFKNKPLGLGKITQSQFCKKPIVAINVDPKLEEIGIQVCNNKEEFIEAISRAMQQGLVKYSIDFKNYDWLIFKREFYTYAKNIIRT